VIRHALAEGWILISQRKAVSLILALALAVPFCLAGVTLTVVRWLEPMVKLARNQDAVAVLLHPHLTEEERQQWLENQQQAHQEWRIESVPTPELAGRLTHWFPYLGDLLDGEAGELLPPLVEITTDDPETVRSLLDNPSVIAVGPRSSLHRLLRTTSREMAWFLGLVSAVLLASAGLLASVWVHLELYRHGDEITIMRLIGATESAVRGPFLVAVVAPGVLAAVVSVLGTVAAVEALSAVLVTLGLPRLDLGTGTLALEAAAACLLPLATATITLHRHAAVDFE
jgi:cell division protein FtsX